MTANTPNAGSRAWGSAPFGRGHLEEYLSTGITTREVRAWLHSRGVDAHTKGLLPKSAYEAFLRAHPERDTRE